jgi:hypothetical protein
LVEKTSDNTFFHKLPLSHHILTNHSSNGHGNKVLVRPAVLGLRGLGGLTHLQDVGEVTFRPTGLLLLWGRRIS